MFTFISITAQEILPQRMSISDSERIAKGQNLSLKKGLNRVASAEGKYLSGVSPKMPELSLSYDFVPNGTGLSNFEERSLEINQEFEFPLKTIYKGEQLNSAIDIIKAENDVEGLNVLSEVRKAYVSLLARQSLVKVAEENLAVADEFRGKSTIRFNLGEATNLEKLTADVQFAQAQNNLEVLKNQYRIAVTDLLFAMGIKNGYGDYEPVLTDSLVYVPFNESPETVMQRTLKTNPVLYLSGLKKTGSQIGKKVAISSYLPDFIVGYKTQAINGVNDYYGINLGISVPLWFLFDQKGKVKEADAEIRISENEYDEAHLNILSTARKAYINLKNSEKQITLFRSTLIPESEEIFRVANASYRIGEITYIEFLQAKQTMITAKESFVTALKDYNLNLIELEKSIGRKLF
ncbi:MAG: TolC family protein [Ignavibacteriota bacterium]